MKDYILAMVSHPKYRVLKRSNGIDGTVYIPQVKEAFYKKWKDMYNMGFNEPEQALEMVNRVIRINDSIEYISVAELMEEVDAKSKPVEDEA